MGKNKQNLINEVNRIKSLFGEKLLWGNLTEQTDDECIDQLEDMGYIISKPGSAENNLTRQHLIGCLYVGGDKNRPSDLYKIYEKIKDETTNIKIEIRERGDNCMLLFKNTSPCIGDELYGSIWEDPIGVWNLQILYKFKQPLIGVLGTDISLAGWEGALNDLTLDYNNLKFMGLYTDKGTRIPASEGKKNHQLKKYIGKNESDTDGDNLDDGTGNPLTYPDYGKLLTQQSGIQTPSGNFINNILKRGSGFCITGMAPWKRK